MCVCSEVVNLLKITIGEWLQVQSFISVPSALSPTHVRVNWTGVCGETAIDSQ